jgi:hypothetical protein
MKLDAFVRRTILTGASAFFVSPLIAIPKGTGCIDKMNFAEQSALFGRVVNLGASFTHGCMTCDESKEYASANELTGDTYWFRRSILLHLFRDRGWKGVSDPRFLIVENDPSEKPLQMVSSEQVRRDGYSGLWSYEPKFDSVQLATKSELDALQANSELLMDSPLVGGPKWKPKMELPQGGRSGVHYIYYDEKTTRPVFQGFDLAVDGGRVQDLFRYFGAGEEYEQLEKERFIDSPLREQAINKVAAHILAIKPTVVFSLDSLFWDAIARTGALSLERGTQSIVLRYILNVMKNAPDGAKMFDPVRNANIREAYLQVLRRVSLGVNGFNGVPVHIARLVDDPLEKFRSRNYENVIAAILGTFIQQATGVDIKASLLRWLEKESDSRATTANFSDVSLTPEQKKQVRLALKQLKKELPSEPTGALGKKDPGIAMRSVSTLLLWNVLKESTELLENLQVAFNETNAALRGFLRTHNHNIRMIDADAFYTDFASYLKPENMHPHFQGANRFANLLEDALCKPGETP